MSNKKIIIVKPTIVIQQQPTPPADNRPKTYAYQRRGKEANNWKGTYTQYWERLARERSK